MFSAGLFDVLIDCPYLPLRHLIHTAILRRFFIGLSMGVTAIFIFNSAFGKNSGAYINPSVTWVQYRLGHLSGIDAVWYIVFQFLGGTMGMFLIYYLLPKYIAEPSINYIVTIPLQGKVMLAFVLEFFISFVMIAVVLFSGISKTQSKYTGLYVAILITLFITFEAPYSGMSMNPARTFASAIIGNQWNSFWLYCIAPVLGMWSGEFIFVQYQKRKEDSGLKINMV